LSRSSRHQSGSDRRKSTVAYGEQVFFQTNQKDAEEGTSEPEGEKVARKPMLSYREGPGVPEYDGKSLERHEKLYVSQRSKRS